LWIFVVTATFSRLLSGLWAEFLELFCGFLQLQLLFSQFFRLMGWFWGAVLEISAVTATFLGFYPVFGLNFGSCFKDLVITAPQGLPTMLSIPCKP